MKVIVTSKNPVKIRAVERAFSETLDPQVLDIVPVSVPSGVSDQPRSDTETRRGALNRVSAGQRVEPDADYWVGMEGGLERHDGEWLASAWMVISDRDGVTSEARTPTLPLPPPVQVLLDQGLELGEANDRVFSTLNSKQKGGAFGLLTDGRLTREGVYAQTLVLALVPHCHALWQRDD